MAKTNHSNKKATAPVLIRTTVSTSLLTTPPAIPQLTTFQPDECTTSMPPNPIQHEVVFAEIKKLGRTIDDLPYNIILTPSPSNFPTHSENTTVHHLMPTIDLDMSKLGMNGGVPIERAFDKNLRDLLEPAIRKIPLQNLSQVLSRRELTVQIEGGTRKFQLKDADIARLLTGQPLLLSAISGSGFSFWSATLPNLPKSPPPLANVYDVGTLPQFVANPVLNALDGSQVPVKLSGSDLIALRSHSELKKRIFGKSVTLRTSVIPPRGIAIEQRLINSTTSRSEPLESSEVNDITRDEGVVRADNTIDPSQLVSVTALKLALYLPWRQYWRLKGYSRGELLHSVVLAPQEETNIEVSTWDRRKRTFEESAQSEFEQTSEFTTTEKDTTAVTHEIASQNDFGVSIGGEIGYRNSNFNVSGRSSTDDRNSLRDSCKRSLDTLSESVRKATSKLRLQRETKIGETSEFGTEQKTTRKVKNVNLCHTLSFNYYEVLAHYDIVTEFAKENARLCVLVKNPTPINEFTQTNVRYFDSVLRSVLLVPALASGLDAAKKLEAQEQLCEAQHRNKMCAPLGTPTDDTNAALAAQAGRVIAAFKTLNDVDNPGAPLAYAIPVLLPIPWPSFTMSLIQPNPFRKWLYLQRIRQIQPHLCDVLSSQISSVGSPLASSAVQDILEALGEISDLKALSPQSMSEQEDVLYGLIRAGFHIPPATVLTGVPKEAYAVNDEGLAGSLSTLRDLVLDAKAAKEKADAAAAMAANQASVQSDYTNKEIAEALEEVDALLHHLNQYKNYYRTMIFKLLPFPDEFVNLLTIFSPLVEPRVVGFDGDMVALSINADLDPRTQMLFKELVTDNQGLMDLTVQDNVILPTAAIHVESRLGSCSGCEDFIEETRELELAIRRQQVRQATAEADRLEKRLNLGTPMLDDPKPMAPKLLVEIEKQQDVTT
jgi:hypothetical protein